MALRHWFVVLFVVPLAAGGCVVASLTDPVRRLLALGEPSQLLTWHGLAAVAATAALVTLLYALAVRGGVVRGVFAASACLALTPLAVFGWLFAITLVWAYALCEPGTHDMCLRR